MCVFLSVLGSPAAGSPRISVAGPVSPVSDQKMPLVLSPSSPPKSAPSAPTTAAEGAAPTTTTALVTGLSVTIPEPEPDNVEDLADDDSYLSESFTNLPDSPVHQHGLSPSPVSGSARRMEDAVCCLPISNAPPLPSNHQAWICLYIFMKEHFSNPKLFFKLFFVYVFFYK